MSTTVDNRIVEMKFNNSNFEKNIKQSKESLEKFKESLNLSKSADSFNKSLNSAVNNVSFDSMANSLEYISSKFSTLGIIGITVLQNLTNSAIAMAKRMVSSVTSAVVTGGRTRAQNIENAKFQLEGFGVSWKKISNDINYGVEDTAYGLDSAAMAASQLVASGVEFGETFGKTGSSPMAKALRGISGLAAMTNSSYDDMSRIFTTVAGNGRLMGDQLLQISSRGVNAAATLVDIFNKVNAGDESVENISADTKKAIKELTGGLNITEEQLRDFVSKGKISFDMFSESMDAAFGEHAKDANKTLQGVLSNIRAALAKIGADFWTPIIENEGKLVDMLMSVKTLINDIKSAIREVLGWAENDEGIGYLTKWKDLTDSIFTSLKEKIDKIDREKLGKNIENIIKSIQFFGKGFIKLFDEFTKITHSFKTAFSSIFKIDNSNQVTGFIKSLAIRFQAFTKSIKINGDTIHKITNVFKGFFAIIDIGVSILSGIFDVIKDIVSEIFPASEGVLSVASSIGKLLVKLDEFLKKNRIIQTVFSTISNVISTIIQTVKSFVTAVVDGFSNVALGSESAAEGFEKIKDKLKELNQKVSDFVKKYMPKLTSGGLKIGEIFGKVANAFSKIFGKLKEFVSAIAPGITFVISSIASLLDKVVDLVIKLVNNLDFDNAFNGIKNGFFTVLLGEITLFISQLSTKLSTVADILNKFTWKLADMLGADGARSTIIKNFAISIAILAGSLFVLSSIDPDKLTAPLAALTSIMWQFVSIIKILNPVASISSTSIRKSIIGMFDAISTGTKLRDQGTMFIKLAAAIFILAGALRMLAELSGEELATGLAGITAIIVELVILSEYLEKNSTQMVSASGGLIAFSVGVAILAKVVKSLSELSWKELAKGLAGLAGILATIAGLAVVLSKTESSIRSFGLSLIPFAVGVVILSAAVKSLAELSWNELAKGLAGLAGILAGIAGLAVTLNSTASSLMSVGLSLIPFAVGVVILSAAVKSLAELSWNELAKGLAGLAGILAGISGLAVTLNSTASSLMSVGLAMIPFALGVAILASSLKKMGDMSWDNILKGLVALAGVLAGVAGLAISMQYTGSSLIKTSAGLLVFAMAMAVLTPVLKALGGMSWTSIAKSILMLAGVLTVLGVAANVLQLSIKPLLGLAAAVALFGAGCLMAGAGILMLGTGLAALGGSFAAIGVGIATLIKSILSILPEIVKAFGTVIKEFANVIADAIPSVVKAFVSLIRGICDAIIEALPMIFDTIIKVLDYLVQYVPQIVDRVISIIIKVIEGLANRMPELVGAIAKLVKSFIDAILDLFKDVTLGDFLAAIKDLSAAAVLLAVAGQFGIAALKGIAILAAMIVGIGAIVTALGWLVSKVPEIEEFLERGIPVLEKIGYGIGSFIGNIVGGVLAGISNGLPAIAENLSLFMTNLQPFLDSVSGIDESTANGALALAKTILVLTGASLLDGIASLFGSDTSFETLGEQLVPFATAMKDFAAEVEGLDSGVVENAALAGKAIAEMAAALPNSGGVAGFFAGENDMSIVGPQLKDFGAAIMDFANEVEGLDGDVVTNAANAGKAIAEMAKALPNSGGVAGFFAGENDMETIAPQLVKFGWAMRSFSLAVAGIDAEAVTNSAIAGQAVAEMASTLPNSGGVVGFFAGENDLGTFAAQLVPFGLAMRLYSIAVSGIDAGAVVASAIAGSALAIMADTIPNTGGLVAFFTGDNKLDEFGEQLIPFGESMKSYSEAVVGIDAGAVVASAIAGAALAAMADTVPNTGGLVDFFTGSNDLGKFGDQLIIFGGALKDYSVVVADMDVQAAWYSALIGLALTSLATTVPESGGLFSLFGGDNDMATFGRQLVAFGQGLVDFSLKVTEINYEAITTAITNLQSLIDFLTLLSYIDPTIGTTFSASLSAIATTGISGFTGAFDNAVGDAQSAISSFIEQAVKAFDGFDKDMKEPAEDGVKAFIKAFTEKNQTAYNAGDTLGTYAKNGVKNSSGKLYDVGRDAAQGFINGINSKSVDVYNAAYKMGKNALDAAKEAVDSNSPSKEFEKLGVDNGRGLIIGLEKITPVVSDASSNMSTAALKSVANTISMISQMINDNVDVNPTITPVFDLSEIQNGMNSMNGMMAGNMYLGNTSLNLARGLYPKNVADDPRFYNDVNVLSAINDLSDRMDLLGDKIAGMQVVLNSGQLVGGIATEMNNKLGNMNILAQRGVL